MKKNFILLVVLLSLLGGTYYLVEILPLKKNQHRDEWKLIVHQMKSLELKNTKFIQTEKGWQDVDGFKVKTHLLLEFSKILSSFEFNDFIFTKEESTLFTDPLVVLFDQTKLIIGDITPAGDKFYLKKNNDSQIYLISLDQIPSQVMGEDEKKLNYNKWIHVRDFILADKLDWQEKRIIFYDKVGAFNEIKMEGHSLKPSQATHTLFDQIKNRLSDLKWYKMEPLAHGVSGYKISFLLDSEVKSEWILTTDQKVIIPSMNQVFFVADQNWLKLFEVLQSEDDSKVVWSPFRLCFGPNKGKAHKNVECPVGFEMTPLGQMDKINQ